MWLSFRFLRAPSVSRSLARWPARLLAQYPARVRQHVSVDHWRAGLRAGAYVVLQVRQCRCQSIIGALACAPLQVNGAYQDNSSVSRSLARWPARHRHPGSRQRQGVVSVDHWRAGLRAGVSVVVCVRPDCVSVDHWRAGLRAEPGEVQLGPVHHVSVDHWRAGLRAAERSPAEPLQVGVSRSLARWPARQPRSQVLIIPLVALAFASATPSAYSTGSRTVISDLPNPSGGKS